MHADHNRASTGVEYICADGTRVQNIHEKMVPGLTDTGATFKVNLQVTDVDKSFIAVSKLTAAGYDVWFDERDGVIRNKRTGKETKFTKKNGVYVIRIWAPRSSSPLSGGIRQRAIA